MTLRFSRVLGEGAAAMLFLATVTTSVWAQDAVATTAPTPAVAPPPGYPPAPAGYAYVPAASVPNSGYQPALELPYEAGQPIPIGYHLKEEPRRGLVVAGYIVSGIPYGVSVMVATGSDFDNATGYLLVPFFGPWMTMGRRNYSDCTNDDDETSGWGCAADSLVVMTLIMDGIVQAGGGAMLLSGYLATRKKLVRNEMAWSIFPRLMGTGYGLSAQGTF